ncbi:MAG: hypothetical protein JO165_09285 [Candidatus Eremiobacteraeota bacterium]|nr:hypothetical protein [Candidatus Eremiobacteraeota bacterium]
MIPFQRLIALAMAIVMVLFFLVPLALRQHATVLAGGLILALVVYLAFNAWLFMRMRKRDI